MDGKNCWCGRDAETKEGDCIFHASIDKKKPKDFWERFEIYFEETLEEYEEAETKAVILFDCSYFVFPPFGEWKFPKEIPFHIVFTNAVFYGDAEFAGIEFKGQALFVETQFHPCPEFLLIKMYTTMGTFEYPGFANFSGSLFSLKANFADSKFFCVADFRKGRFLAEVNFRGAEFHENADFKLRVFEGETNFNFAEFERGVYFNGSSFTKKVEFGKAVFKRETFFSGSEFRNKGVFAGTEFYDYIYLEQVVKEFERDADGNIVKVGGGSKKVKDGEACIDFVYNRFFDKAKVYTYKTSVRKWRFEGTYAIKDPGIFGFEETVWKTEGDKRKTVYEEELIGSEDITYERVGEIYRLLRLNFESRLAYEKASDFHVGQMEMLLLDSDVPLSKKVFLLAYRLISNYGESVLLPLFWLIYFAAIFACFWSYLGFYPEVGGPKCYDFYAAILHTMKTYFTLPSGDVPVTEFLMGIAQRLVGGTFITFAILALKRAFKR